MIRLLYIRWHRRQIIGALERIRYAMHEAAIHEQQFEDDLRRVEAAIACAELDRRAVVRW